MKFINEGSTSKNRYKKFEKDITYLVTTEESHLSKILQEIF